MKNKTKLYLKLTVLVIFLFSIISMVLLFAQGNPAGNKTKGSEYQSSTAIVDIEPFIIDDFEQAGLWYGVMPRDMGIIRVMKREGGPTSIKEKAPEKNKFVLGAKVKYFTPGFNWFGFKPPKPVKIPGIAKALSIWVAGRNYNHTLDIVIRNYKGKLNAIPTGRLNFMGWKELSGIIPISVPQDDFHTSSERGILFESILVKCDPKETSGTYYIYLDNLKARTDLFMEKEDNKDPDDPSDEW